MSNINLHISYDKDVPSAARSVLMDSLRDNFTPLLGQPGYEVHEMKSQTQAPKKSDTDSYMGWSINVGSSSDNTEERSIYNPAPVKAEEKAKCYKASATESRDGNDPNAYGELRVIVSGDRVEVERLIEDLKSYSLSAIQIYKDEAGIKANVESRVVLSQ